jgi:transposase
MAQKIIFTDEQINKMVALYNEGKLIKEIAPLFNTSNSTVARTLKKASVASRHPSLSKEREQLAIDYYNKYHNMTKVGKLVHMSEKTVKDVLTSHGIKVLSNSEAHKRCHIDEHYFDEIDNHRKAYYLGLMCADGTVSKKNNRVQIALQERDKYVVEELKKDLRTDYKISLLPYSKKNPKWSDQVCLTLTNTAVHDALVSHGVVPNKSQTLEFPINLKEEYYSSFILGYMDGDGHITDHPKDRRCNLVSTEKFCLSVAKIIKDKLDINSSIMLCHRKDNVPTRVLSIAGKNQVKKFLDWIYSESDIYLERKHNIYQRLYK